MTNSDQETACDKSPKIAGDTPLYNSQELLKGQREVRILHGNEIYRLRTTSRGKLLLQK